MDVESEHIGSSRKKWHGWGRSCFWGQESAENSYGRLCRSSPPCHDGLCRWPYWNHTVYDDNQIEILIHVKHQMKVTLKCYTDVPKMSPTKFLLFYPIGKLLHQTGPKKKDISWYFRRFPTLCDALRSGGGWSIASIASAFGWLPRATSAQRPQAGSQGTERKATTFGATYIYILKYCMKITYIYNYIYIYCWVFEDINIFTP